MSQLNHSQLADLRDNAAWSQLWLYAMRGYRLAIASLLRSGQARAADVDDDLAQAGALAVGEAVRRWDPLESTLLTYVTAYVRGSLLNQLVSRTTPPGVALDDVDTDVEDGEPALTYDGLLLESGQYDGLGETPEGYGDPADEAARLQEQGIARRLLDSLNHQDFDAVVQTFGIGGAKRAEPKSTTAYRVHRAILKLRKENT